MISSYTAKYTRVSTGYMGQLIDWPEVVTEGASIEDCRIILRDALGEMVSAYRQLGNEIPVGDALLEQLPVDLDRVCQTS